MKSERKHEINVKIKITKNKKELSGKKQNHLNFLLKESELERHQRWINRQLIRKRTNQEREFHQRTNNN